MNKKNAGYLSLFFTFILGVCLVWVFSIFSNPFSSNPKVEINTFNESTKTLTKNEVEVGFEKFNVDNNGFYLGIVVTNKTSNSVFYSGYNKESVIKEFKVDGVEKKQWICGTGLNEIELKSNESVKFKIYKEEISYHLEKGKILQVGIDFKEINEETPKRIWSEPIYFPKALKEQLD
jgi:hypothetical protein